MEPAGIVVFRDGLVAAHDADGQAIGLWLSPAELREVERRVRAAELEPAALTGNEPCCDQPVTIIRANLDGEMIEAATYGTFLYLFVTPTASRGQPDPLGQDAQPNRFPRGMPELDLLLHELAERVAAGPHEMVDRPLPVIPVVPIQFY